MGHSQWLHYSKQTLQSQPSTWPIKEPQHQICLTVLPYDKHKVRVPNECNSSNVSLISLRIRIILFNVIFNNVSVISWQSCNCIGGGNRRIGRKPSTCRKSMTKFITWCCIEYTSPWVRFELTMLVVIGTDCTGSCKSNYHTITTTTAPYNMHVKTEIIIFNYMNVQWLGNPCAMCNLHIFVENGAFRCVTNVP